MVRSRVRIPKHARKELEAYLDCGLLCRGFARLRFQGCGESRLVAFSCKGRGFCPSCLGRRMDGGKAPFTASRAEDRPDLLKLERELKARGMDVDVQRYYLIQVPLRRDATGVRLSNMGTPPWARALDPVFGAGFNLFGDPALRIR